MQRVFGHLGTDVRGAAAAEFAIVLPLLLAMLLGIVSYGSYFWRAHALQEVANDAARAAIGGATAAERRTIAERSIADQLPVLAGIGPAAVGTSFADTGDKMTIVLSYDATRDVAAGAGFIPLPSPVIRREAVIRLAGL